MKGVEVRRRQGRQIEDGLKVGGSDRRGSRKEVKRIRNETRRKMRKQSKENERVGQEADDGGGGEGKRGGTEKPRKVEANATELLVLPSIRPINLDQPVAPSCSVATQRLYLPCLTLVTFLLR